LKYVRYCLKFMLVSLVLLLWMAQPALACMISSQATMQQMACCQRMDGNCDMSRMQPNDPGSSCCQHTMRPSTAQPSAHTTLFSMAHLGFAGFLAGNPLLLAVTRAGESTESSPPESPPPQLFSLRI
jgi:hypothetical protein